VLAAGGVVWRARDGGGVEVLVVHRPHRRDWSLPKGKVEPGESLAACARREVLEEAGYVCDLGDELPATRYEDDKGRPKEVRFWTMTVRSGSFRPNGEVDEVRWLAPAEAVDVLTYESERDTLLAALELLA
jgi:8-oxo-dGTP diphosphatase